MSTLDHPKVHYTKLEPLALGPELVQEWDFYRAEVGRLLAEGHEGKHVLIKGDQIIGLFDTKEEARQEGYNRYLLTGFLAHQIQTWERVYFVRPWFWWSCHNGR